MRAGCRRVARTTFEETCGVATARQPLLSALPPRTSAKRFDRAETGNLACWMADRQEIEGAMRRRKGKRLLDLVIVEGTDRDGG